MTEIVLWSGGMDSTLLLLQKINEYQNDRIRALSVITPTVGKDRLKMEKRAKNKLLKIWDKRVDYEEIKINTSMNPTTWQLPIWLSHAMPYIEDKDILNMGYLSSDGFDFWHAKENMIKVFNAMMELQGKPHAKVDFPLQAWTKGQVIRELKKEKILNKTWYCGQPKKDKPCGKCMKCISVKRWSKYPETGEYV